MRVPSFLRPSRRIIVHVGLPKCGSSTIQRHMAGNAQAHLADGVCYPETGQATDGYRNHLPLARMAPQDLAGAVDAIHNEAGTCHTVVVSCEDWANTFPRCNLVALCDTIARRMPGWDLRIVAYFRNPFDFVESCYAQYVMAGLFQVSRDRFYRSGDPSIERFLALFEVMRGFPLWSNLGFVRLLGGHLPGHRLSLRSIEKEDVKHGEMLTDFCALARLPAPGPAAHSNIRLSNRKLAELEHVQTLVDQDTYGALRDRLIAQEFPRLPEADNRRVTTLHIGHELARSISKCIAEERAPLSRLLDTRASALCAVPARDWTRHDMLGPRDHDILARFVDMNTGKAP